MIHIAICDDERKFVSYLIELLDRYSNETEEKFKITPFMMVWIWSKSMILQ